ncbi:CYFIP-related Rac1 interactor B [Lepeophtheirus salmonis]|uniref:CYRIA/CYRIB Rac1 binding domain-containing protein n=1 Tax=Lepeophtheirus salmonis TaxID=72036 RepID=A0A0K2UL96_LEPSM|nr:CYFIP-related Rac1 interactor B-like [Lepeophtheirus salmonis]
MGNIFRLLARDGEACCALPPKYDVFVDFENAAPVTPDETLLYEEAESLLKESLSVLGDLQNYKGASKEIREAIGKPSPQTQSAAWNALLPSLQKLKRFYVFSQKMEFLVPKLLDALIEKEESDPATILEILDERQALVKQFAKILEFVLKFDELKLVNPALQNDFAYYRRTTQKSKNRDPFLNIDMAASMSPFFGHAAPMLKSISSCVEYYIAREDDPSKTRRALDTLSVMANICVRMLDSPNLKARIRHPEETECFILRVMTAVIILYDHVHPVGAFAKSSDVNVKGCVRVLRDQEKSRVESLMNALRYTTKHVNDVSTPKSTKAMLFEELS